MRVQACWTFRHHLVQEAGQADTASVEEEREAQEEVERLDSGLFPGLPLL